MEFKILFYKDNKGLSPIEEYLSVLANSNEPLVAKAQNGIEKLRYRQYHQEPLSKYIEPGLWELRIIAGSNILRILYTFRERRVIILLHIFIKKQQKAPVRELEIARKRLQEIKSREAN